MAGITESFIKKGHCDLIGNGYKLIEIRNPYENYLYRGGIKDLNVKKRYELHVYFTWIAEELGFPHFSGNWVKKDIPEYTVTLEGAGISRDPKLNTMTVRVYTGETLTLYKDLVFDQKLIGETDES